MSDEKNVFQAPAVTFDGTEQCEGSDLTGTADGKEFVIRGPSFPTNKGSGGNFDVAGKLTRVFR